MGYFNFFYKLSRLFNNKKLLKTFLIVTLIFLLIYLFSKPTYAVSPYEEDYADPYTAFTENYGLIQRDFILRLNTAFINGDITEANYELVLNTIASGDYYNFFLYGTSNGSSYNNASFTRF